MSTSRNPQRDQPSTYFVQDRSNKQEMTRLTIQDHMLTTSMGGVLPEQPDPGSLRRVLDVGCGTGGWLIELASAYPSLSRLVGIDISGRMIEYAQTQAAIRRVSDRVEFYVMDALHGLEFSEGSFDLVNQRLGVSFLRTWDWPGLLKECKRVACIGGVIRLTEADMMEGNSPGLAQRERLLQEAFYRAGHLFASEKDGLTRELASMLRRYGLHDIQTQVHQLAYRAGTEEGRRFAENISHGFQTLKPFMQKWALVPENYDELHQQTVGEMRQPDFAAIWRLLTVWGKKPS